MKRRVKPDCGDPRCTIHRDFVTSYKNPVYDDITHYSGDTTPSVTWTAREVSHSCTGPVEIILQFKRDLLQNLEIGDEIVTVTLTEPIV